MGYDMELCIEALRDDQWSRAEEQEWINDVPAWPGVEQEPDWVLRRKKPWIWPNPHLFHSLGWGWGEKGPAKYAGIEPRGLPEDATDETTRQYEREVPGAVNASWLTAAELRRHIESIDDIKARADESGLTAALETMEEFARESGVSEVRAVFWFTD